MTLAVLALVDGAEPETQAAALALALTLGKEGGRAVHLASLGPAADARGCARAWSISAEDGRAAFRALLDLIEHTPYAAVVAADTSACREAIARLAGVLGLPLAARVLAARADGGVVEVTRAVDGGRRTAKYRLACLPALLLVDPDASLPPPVRTGESPAVTSIATVASDPLRLLAERVLEPSELDLQEAAVVVAGGRGVGGPGGFRLLEELAGLLHGSVAATRVAVDLGWAPRSIQVGMTGKVVHPRLYIACGISGAVHHTFGMRDAGFVVAINKDPAAPIFKFADAAIVGDVTEIVPEMIALLRSRAGRPQPAPSLVGAPP